MREPAFAIGQDLVKLIAEIDEFNGRWDALKTLSPDRLNALRMVAIVESIGSAKQVRELAVSLDDLGSHFSVSVRVLPPPQARLRAV